MLRRCFKTPFKRMISTLKYKWSPWGLFDKFDLFKFRVWLDLQRLALETGLSSNCQ